MTTIVYKEGEIAYDSRATKGSMVVDDEYDKHMEVNNHHFFFSGNPTDLDLLVNIYFGEPKPEDGVPECEALVVDDENVIWNISANDEGYLNKFKIDNDKIVAIGSGTEHAMTAMDMGCNAYDAVKMAMKRDLYTGGNINVFKIGLE